MKEETIRGTSPKDTEAPALASYTDYRDYLRDVFSYRKRTMSTAIRQYSYAAFSAAADIKSPNYLKLIIEGQRNLSDEMAKKFAKALNLSKDETDEFISLVHYGQAKDPLDRNRCLKELSDIRVRRQLKAGEINAEAWGKVPSWVTWVLHSLADQEGVSFEMSDLREIMRGRATRDEIKKAFDKLLESGELKHDESGQVVKGRKMMEGANAIPAALVKRLQGELIYLGLESLFQDDPTEREFGALTVALTKQEFEQVRHELRAMRKRIYKDILVNREKSKGERVYQLNMQLFPVTNRTGHGSTED